jgi:endonuclease/exonuclease/phosphatase family metal-dependent hydrolase
MSTSEVTLRQLFRHTFHTSQSQFSLRSTLKQPQGKLTVGTGTAKFDVWVQNMGLLVPAFVYLGRDRDAALHQLIVNINMAAADVVGVCEIYSDGERETVWNGVIGTYPFHAEGPKNGAIEDGGLLLLSRHPILPPGPRHMIFNNCVGDDCLSDKGALHITIQIPGAPTPCDFIFSHAQSTAEEGGLGVLLKQLTQMGNFLETVTHPDRPAFIMGDLNISGESLKDLNEMLERLGKHIGKPVDLWLAAGNAPNQGMTFVADNDFYESQSDNPKLNHRLDYILMRPGKRFVPIVQKIFVQKLKANGHDVSDHFGLRAIFEKHIRVDL